MLFDLVVSDNKFSLICLTFTGTLNQLHVTVIHVHLISYHFVFQFFIVWAGIPSENKEVKILTFAIACVNSEVAALYRVSAECRFKS